MSISRHYFAEARTKYNPCELLYCTHISQIPLVDRTSIIHVRRENRIRYNISMELNLGLHCGSIIKSDRILANPKSVIKVNLRFFLKIVIFLGLSF